MFQKRIFIPKMNILRNMNGNVQIFAIRGMNKVRVFIEDDQKKKNLPQNIKC